MLNALHQTQWLDDAEREHENSPMHVIMFVVTLPETFPTVLRPVNVTAGINLEKKWVRGGNYSIKTAKRTKKE